MNISDRNFHTKFAGTVIISHCSLLLDKGKGKVIPMLFN